MDRFDCLVEALTDARLEAETKPLDADRQSYWQFWYSTSIQDFLMKHESEDDTTPVETVAERFLSKARLEFEILTSVSDESISSLWANRSLT